MLSLLSHAAVGIAVGVITFVITRWLDRRGERIPAPEHRILEVLKKHADEKAGVYLGQQELSETAALPKQQFARAILELLQRGEIERAGAWGEEQFIITEKGVLALARRRRKCLG
jgi:predicted transcriptional regulator